MSHNLKSALRPLWKPAVDRALSLRNRIMAATGLTLRSGRFRLVHTRGRGLGLFLTRDYRAGDPVIEITGQPVAQRGEYTIQIDSDSHIYPDAPLRYANHSCNPNVGIRRGADGRLRFHAMRAVSCGEEMLWDYSMSEHDLEVAGGPGHFPCRCGAPDCRGQVSGWRSLPPETRQRYRDWAMPYLQAAERAGTAPS
jgi:hypothetical protein